jgi:hypothetical protein
VRWWFSCQSARAPGHSGVVLEAPSELEHAAVMLLRRSFRRKTIDLEKEQLKVDKGYSMRRSSAGLCIRFFAVDPLRVGLDLWSSRNRSIVAGSNTNLCARKVKNQQKNSKVIFIFTLLEFSIGTLTKTLHSALFKRKSSLKRISPFPLYATDSVDIKLSLAGEHAHTSRAQIKKYGLATHKIDTLLFVFRKFLVACLCRWLYFLWF